MNWLKLLTSWSRSGCDSNTAVTTTTCKLTGKTPSVHATFVEENNIDATYTNPVVNSNHPDPGILKLPDGSGFVVVSTSDYATPKDDAFPILFSKDLISWEQKGHVFSGGLWPEWSISSMWAPEMHFVNGSFHVYYSAKKSLPFFYRIGLAISTGGPFGPYVDIGVPLLDETAIDATWFQDPKTGNTYLSWKKQADYILGLSHIQIQQVEQDGQTFTPGTSPTTLLTSKILSDVLTVEAPWIIYKQPYYYLFFSVSITFTPFYRVGVARSQNPLGPYERWNKWVIQTDLKQYLFGRSTFVGPGHMSTVQTPDGEHWMAYHAWLTGKVNLNPPGRVLNLDKIKWDLEGWPYIGYPSDTAKQVPNLAGKAGEIEPDDV